MKRTADVSDQGDGASPAQLIDARIAEVGDAGRAASDSTTAPARRLMRGSSRGVGSARMPATAIAARTPNSSPKRPQKAVAPAIVALVLIDHADSVRAIRAGAVC